MFYGRDLDSMVAFYVRCLGLSPTDAGDGYKGMSADGFMAAIRSLGGWVAPNAWKFAGFVRQDVADPEVNGLQLLERCS